jgi:hypothetical protein
MRAIFGSRLDPLAPDLLEGAVAARMIRQKRLTSDHDPLELIALIDEAAVRRQVGGPAAMRRQCLHLIAAAGLKRVTLHVLPASVEVRPAMSGGFTLLYSEHPLGSTNTDKPAAVDRATRLFARLQSLALDPDDSVALIQRVAAET